MKNDSHIILKKNKLNVTGIREKILSLFLDQPEALSHTDIERLAGEKFDRVTVYRTLQAFEEKGIIHIIPTPDNTIRYALCADGCNEKHHNDRHIHFSCTSCNNIFCIEKVELPKIKLPKGYIGINVEVIVSGVCSKCAKNMQ